MFFVHMYIYIVQIKKNRIKKKKHVVLNNWGQAVIM